MSQALALNNNRLSFCRSHDSIRTIRHRSCIGVSFERKDWAFGSSLRAHAVDAGGW